MTVQGHASELYFLADSNFQSEAIGHADVPRSLAGRARQLYELATGTSAFSDESPASPPNPQGNIGHDHSGPPWGSAFLHPIATISGKKDNGGNLQQSVGSQPVISLDAGGIPFASVGPWVIANRLFAKIPPPSGGASNLAPYSRGYVRGIAHRTGSGTVTLAVALVSLDHAGQTISSMSSSVSLSSSSETEFTISDAWFILGPGRNAVRFDFSTTNASAGIVVDSLSICQIVKRSH